MFRNNFEKTIGDSIALFNLLEGHLSGHVKDAIEPCVFSAPSVDWYEQAMAILSDRYCNKNVLIRAHKAELMNRKLINDSIADIEKLANELKCFHSVLVFYKANLEYFSGEVVKTILEKRLSKKIRAELTNYMCTKGFL